MQLKALLDTLYADRSQRHLANDPLSFCHRYASQEDREIAGLVSASFAYGNVKIILRNLDTVFGRMGASPRRYVETFEPEDGLKRFEGFKHRFNDGRDLCALLYAARTMIEEADTIGEYFLGFHDPEAKDITPALIRFTEAVLGFNYQPVFGSHTIPADSAFPFLFPSPASGSACKRLCMLLRWMVRPEDGIDLGIWKGVSPAQLVIPVDAHISRIARLLGLTGRKQADWKMAQEITAALRALDPEDPVKYDFPLCHLGISEGCDGTRSSTCITCPVSGECRVNRI
ncbi:TIGR02757 family protein [Geobacter sp. DSM 9736]|uniref:TIGR02757 family protein n=1 Tax=Geobacter sp. DSM 9736 TaxID=1277350 RepID=UPI000B5019F4|nr:TIGR02757 family protein [Geobacter sp. DSM 9736]SNB46769.1 TIGR02757 family protein [Geobacter sp. DSM 9736]